jgi:hypothetical protein
MMNVQLIVGKIYSFVKKDATFEGKLLEIRSDKCCMLVEMQEDCEGALEETNRVWSMHPSFLKA